MIFYKNNHFADKTGGLLTVVRCGRFFMIVNPVLDFLPNQ